MIRTLFIALSLLTIRSQDIFVPYFDGTGIGNHLQPDVLAFWQFDETSGTAADSSPNSHTLTEYAGSVASDSSGVRSNARLFPGSGSPTNFFTLAANTNFNLGSGDFTFTCWAKMAPWDHDSDFISRWDNFTNCSYYFGYDFGTPSSMVFYWSDDGTPDTSAKAITYNSSIPSGAWMFTYVVRRGNIIYLSTTQLGDTNLAPPVSEVIFGTLFDSTAAITSGNYITSGGSPTTANMMNGSIDEMGVWKGRALTDCELLQLYNNSAALAYASFDPLPCGSYTNFNYGYDNFDAYADATNLGDQTGWSAVNGTMSIAGGKVYSNTAATHTGVRKTTPTFGANQMSWVTLNWPSPGFIGSVGPSVRMQAGSANWYGLFWDPNGSTLYLFEVVSGSFTAIVSTSKTYVTGNRLRITVTGTGAGIRLSADEDIGAGWVNVWTNQAVSSTLNSGQPGVHGYGSNVTYLSMTDWHAQDF